METKIWKIPGKYLKYRYTPIFVNAEKVDRDRCWKLCWPKYQIYVDPWIESDEELTEEQCQLAGEWDWVYDCDATLVPDAWACAVHKWERYRKENNITEW